MSLDELAAQKQLIFPQFHHGHRLVVEVDHPQRVVRDAPPGVRLHPRLGRALGLRHAAHQSGKRPARRQAQGEGLRGSRLRRRHGDTTYNHK
ncbi:unnamed protein product [Leptidea sinapis]|uniref:Uncharacterized protein n=1 Tax=Leptidea sinapis TaxID=189913 RepID=A0A5E4Q1J6_9NEOP|nr:unnamed protein product [Leptidea sinapis]